MYSVQEKVLKKNGYFLQSMLLHYSRFGIPLIELEKNPIETITSGIMRQ